MGGPKKEMLKGKVTEMLPSSLPANVFCVQQGWMVGGGMALLLQTVVKFWRAGEGSVPPTSARRLTPHSDDAPESPVRPHPWTWR